MFFCLCSDSSACDTSSCSRTQKYSESSPDIAYAKSLARATPGAVIFGKVTHDREGGDRDSQVPLANVRVIVLGKDKQVEATTDDEGRYKTPSLPAGEYTVRVEPPQGMSDPERKIKNHLQDPDNHFVQSSLRMN